MTLNIRETIGGDSALTPTSGELIYNIIQKEIGTNSAIDLDFKGIEIITSAFLNAAVGRLYAKYSSEELNALLHIKNISSDDLSILKKVIERAKEYFIDKRSFNERMDQTFE
ncbi:STAS-like domain-containing protein [Mucilaginibacter flavidus]|uniref:STAS-like domain-containing protein n=1 Tax=Mucilaginibacter flavidus TaxID=2949309 RepID=UPI0020930828|nr:STAS-like domain-containing protein [Mucilaginibacter flavidus]MCO5950856.1 STAS-like domain-containing protein [Mucilaginibacter flavidus]